LAAVGVDTFMLSLLLMLLDGAADDDAEEDDEPIVVEPRELLRDDEAEFGFGSKCELR
jgi:hypothetical protein